MVLSAMVQMKNTLVKYLDFEVDETNTQVPVIDYNQELTSAMTPESVFVEPANLAPQN